MNVFYTCDNNYVWLMGISLISLYENNVDEQSLEVFLLGDNISDENKRILNEIADKYNRKISLVDVPDLNIPPALYNERWPRSAYTRLYSGLLLPEYVDKAIYLDCDTIIQNSLKTIYDLDVSDCSVRAVKDCVGKRYKKNIGLTDKAPYFNAGVLLVNVSRLRVLDVSNRIQNFFESFSKRMIYADQDVLNGIFCNEIKELPAEANSMTILHYFSYKEIMKMRNPNAYYSESQIHNAVYNPIVVHFTTCMYLLRPWFEKSDHPYVSEFLKHKENSPWKDLPLKKKIKMNSKERLLSLIFCLPRQLGVCMVGFLHSKLVPFLKGV